MRFTSDARAYPAQLGRFLWSWVQNPTAVGALVPSGRELSRLMVQGVLPGSRVIELGAGTGTVTRAILEAGVEPEDLDVVEMDSSFVKLLRVRFPDIGIHAVDATTISRRRLDLHGHVDFVISCLPLLLLSRAQKMRLLTGAFAMLGPGGVLHQFTYGARCPIDQKMLARIGLTAQRIGVATRNLPPAFVYRVSRVGDSFL